MMKITQIKSTAGDAKATKHLDRLLNDMAEHTAKLGLVPTFDTRFGEVFCTSGVKAKSDWIIDWGLAKLDLQRFGDFKGLSSVSLRALHRGPPPPLWFWLS